MTPLKGQIIPCLWFDRQAEEAVKFYTELFGDYEIGTIARYGQADIDSHGMPEDTVLTVSFKIHGQEFLALNGGPNYQFSPGISFFVVCGSLEEADRVWAALEQGGTVMMPFDQYDWSEKYGWLNDRYGLSWQVSLGKISDVGQKFTPSLMFVGEKFGKAEEAIHFYTGIFKDSVIEGISRYAENEGDVAGRVKHAQFYLQGNTFMVMESSMAHEFEITPAVSFIIHCDTQEEIDYYWDKLTQGDGDEVQCGWLYDKFGVSWQVVSKILTEGMADPVKAKKLIEAFMPMKKLDIKTLEAAIA